MRRLILNGGAFDGPRSVVNPSARPPCVYLSKGIDADRNFPRSSRVKISVECLGTRDAIGRQSCNRFYLFYFGRLRIVHRYTVIVYTSLTPRTRIVHQILPTSLCSVASMFVSRIRCCVLRWRFSACGPQPFTRKSTPVPASPCTLARRARGAPFPRASLTIQPSDINILYRRSFPILRRTLERAGFSVFRRYPRMWSQECSPGMAGREVAATRLPDGRLSRSGIATVHAHIRTHIYNTPTHPCTPTRVYRWYSVLAAARREFRAASGSLEHRTSHCSPRGRPCTAVLARSRQVHRSTRTYITG